MKKIFISVFLLLGLIQSAFAQNPDTLKAVCNYNLFPVGGLRYPVADMLSHMLGMNFNWSGFGGGGTNHTFAMQAQPDNDDSYALYDPFYYNTDSTATLTTHSQAGIMFAASYGVDARIFMPGTSGGTKENTYGWNNKSGLLHTLTPEWEIQGDTAALGYVLSDLNGIPNVRPSAASEPYGAGGWGQSVLDPNHIGTFSYDFVYFFDTTLYSVQWSSAANSDALYSIEYWTKKYGDTAYSFYIADTITKAKYRNLSKAVTQAPNHSVSAENLATWTGQRTNLYKIQKRILRIDTFYVDHNSAGDKGYSPQVDVRLRNFKKIPIFVRCLRIRDWVGQRLLTGKADIQLEYAIGHLQNFHNNGDLKSWTIANEVNYRSFHAWSYLNDLSVHLHAPPLNVLAPYDYDLFQRVMNDQTQYDKPYIKSGVLWHEWTPFGGEPWRAVGRNGATHRPERYWGYQGFGNPFPYAPMPFPFAVGGDTIALMNQGISVIQDYDNFTSHIQNEIIGFNSDAIGGGVGDCQSQFFKSQACYLFDPSHPQPYLLMTQANPYRAAIAKWAAGDSTLYGLVYDSVFDYWKAHVKNDHDAGVLADNAATINRDTLYYTKVMKPYLDRHTGTNIYNEDSLFDDIYIARAPTRAESYYQFWSGVEHGMKGYCVNIAYDDRQIQNGIIFDTTGYGGTDSLVRSQDRTCITIEQCGDQNPFHSHNNFFPFVGNTCPTYRYLELPPGFRQMFPTFRTIITQELAPIAAELAKLSWQGALSWHKRDSALANLSLLPVKNVQSRTLTNSLDSASSTFVDFGIFKDPTDSIAMFISVLNRRLYSDPEDTLTTDYRRISFQVDSTKFNSPYSKFPMWRITDVSGKLKDTVVTGRDTFLFTVKPGQG